MEPLERTFRVKRAKLFQLKTCLLACETIPAGSFLFYNLSEMISFQEYKVEERFSMYGAGKNFLISLDKVKSTPTYDQAADSKWDFRFLNLPPVLRTRYASGRKQRCANVELRESLPVQFSDGIKAARGFYTTERVESGTELLFDYKYHRRTKLHCSCGTVADECPELNRKDSDDFIVEKVIKHYFQPNKENRYFVKWKNFDHVNNTWQEECELLRLNVFKKYEKRRKKLELRERERNPVVKTIRCGGDDCVENADSSSGEEDDRCVLKDSAPFKIVHVARELVRGHHHKYCYVKFSNMEIHRMRKRRIQKCAPQLLIAYYESIVQLVGTKPIRPSIPNLEPVLTSIDPVAKRPKLGDLTNYVPNLIEIDIIEEIEKMASTFEDSTTMGEIENEMSKHLMDV